jgi:integral membrane sensor domain MASE1
LDAVSQAPREPGKDTGAQRDPDLPPLWLQVRSRPNFGAFIGTGAALGVILGLVLDRFGPNTPQVEALSSTAFFVVLGAFVGGLLGAVVAVLVDRRN